MTIQITTSSECRFTGLEIRVLEKLKFGYRIGSGPGWYWLPCRGNSELCRPEEVGGIDDHVLDLVHPVALPDEIAEYADSHRRRDRQIDSVSAPPLDEAVAS